MAEKIKTVPGRNGGTLTPIQKGEVRNPKGGRKGKRVSTEMKKLLEAVVTIEKGALNRFLDKKKGMLAEHVAAQIIAKALRGDIPAARELLDRSEGKVPQTLGGTDEEPPIQFQITLTDKEKNEYDGKFNAKYRDK